MSRIFWDTNLYIYLFEGHPQFTAPTSELPRRMIERGDELLTSSMTLAEVQVKALRANQPDLARRLSELVSSTSQVIAFDQAAAAIFARLRVDRAVKPQDAIQLSCAAAAGVELFVTNDERLEKLRVPGIHFITTLERVPI